MSGEAAVPHREIEEAQETAPCQSLPRPEATSIWRVLVYGSLMIVLSVILINFNKLLITGKFPFPMHLVMMHTITGSVFASTLYRVVPSLFPSLSDPLLSVRVDRDLVLGKVLPVAIAFAGTLVLSNVAYKYASVAFLQFMKEGNVILVYCLSLAVGLERFRSQAFRILAFIMLATMICIHGEMKFSMLGFLIQGASQVFEVTRIVLQAMVLSSRDTKLDAMTYVLIVLPVCFVVLLLSALLLSVLETRGVLSGVGLPSPRMEDVVEAAPLLCCSAVLAFGLNVSMALFIKNTSAVSFVLAGIIKDCCVVLLSLMLFHDTISHSQMVGFALQLFGILTWSLMKQRPDAFERFGMFVGLRVVLFGDDSKSKT